MHSGCYDMLCTIAGSLPAGVCKIYTILHNPPETFIYFRVIVYSFCITVHWCKDETSSPQFCYILFYILFHGSISSLMIAIFVQPKHVVAFTRKIKFCLGCNPSSVLFILINLGHAFHFPLVAWVPLTYFMPSTKKILGWTLNYKKKIIFKHILWQVTSFIFSIPQCETCATLQFLWINLYVIKR